MLTISRQSDHPQLGGGAFQIRRIHPGLRLNLPDDAGLGPLGLVDHATVQGGVVVPMHEHRNDEILSYIRQGSVMHEDTTGRRELLTSTHLMMMSSGQGTSHKESVQLANAPLEMLQIFVRPRQADLAPQVAFHRFETADSPNAWRLIGGPEEANPLTIRSAVWLYDAQLTQHTLPLPVLPGHTAFLYVFSGRVAIEGVASDLQKGDSAIIADEQVSIQAPQQAQVVVFLVDRRAEYSRAGSLSG
ncbi:pirin family protein [Spirosoma arcticum]